MAYFKKWHFKIQLLVNRIIINSFYICSIVEISLFYVFHTTLLHYCPHAKKQLCCQQKYFLHLIDSICMGTLAVCLTYSCQMQTLLLHCYSTCSKDCLEISPIRFPCTFKKRCFVCAAQIQSESASLELFHSRIQYIFGTLLVSIFPCVL